MEPLLHDHDTQQVSSPCCKRLIYGIVCFSFAIIMTGLLFQTPATLFLTNLPKEALIATQAWTSSQQKTETFPKEIAISYFPRQTQQRFSKFRCTGAQNDIQAAYGRVCVFYNLCYNTRNSRFYYYRLSRNQTRPLFYDASKRMLYTFSDKNDGTGFISLSAGGGTLWSPIVSDDPFPIENVTTLSPLHSLMQIRFAGENIAHGLWEDFGSISYSMDRLNVFDPDLVIMHFGKISTGGLSDTYNRYVLPSLSTKPLVELDTYAKSFNTTFVCFKQIIAGGQLSVFPRPQIRENHGREALFYNWRSKVIKVNGFDPNFVPKQHHIIITNKSQSIWTHAGSKRHRAIVNLEEVAQFIRQTYPNISSEAVEWHKIPFNQQVAKLLNTTIFITPCGGVSLIIPFLPNGAHAIVMDYYTNQAAHGYKVGESGSMEGAFLNHISHVRMQYYQLFGPQDFEFDFPGATNSREQASVKVNTTRLRVLIDKALEEMEP